MPDPQRCPKPLILVAKIKISPFKQKTVGKLSFDVYRTGNSVNGGEYKLRRRKGEKGRKWLKNVRKRFHKNYSFV